ncbi:MAG TPA: hypothetical protein VF996_02130 [Candidatus Saccharimonadales bacterium]|jgi:hypothetical protein
MADSKTKAAIKSDSGGGMVYFLGFIGAAIFFVQTAEGFWDGVVGILQAIVWPAYLVLEFFQNFYN